MPDLHVLRDSSLEDFSTSWEAMAGMTSTVLKPVSVVPRRLPTRIHAKQVHHGLTAPKIKPKHAKMHPVAASDGECYEGQFGTWKLEPEDKLEVQLYRGGLTVAAVCLGVGVAGSFITNGAALENDVYNVLCVLGAGGLGLSFVQIHIYVASLKRFVQGLWAVGAAGGAALMITQVGMRDSVLSMHTAYQDVCVG